MNLRRTRHLLLVMPLALMGLACGDDGDSSGSSTDSRAAAGDAIVEIFVEMLGEEGLSESEARALVDEECVGDLAAQLSEDDAAAIVEDGVESSISMEGENTLEALFDCVDFEG